MNYTKPVHRTICFVSTLFLHEAGFETREDLNQSIFLPFTKMPNYLVSSVHTEPVVFEEHNDLKLICPVTQS